MNHIEQVRMEITKSFNPTRLVKNSGETFISPNNNYRLETAEYLQDLPGVNWAVTKVQVFDQETNKMIFDFFCNYSRFFYAWLETGNKEYLICSEDIYGGQTIIDLSNRQMSSYSPSEDGFIWTDFYLSPDGKTLATIGCYWAYDYVIKLFGFTDPLNLPLKELKEIELIADDEVISGWVSNEAFKTKGIKKEIEIERFVDGSQRDKLIGETEIERLININSN